ncbi:hypothetical protein GOP47_0016026 [Adiantum capillus-veneris]|uniref:SRP54-type proteins GTP-binding domain-containing protein n=1 Tax=Adiantum capillus-veneris TaxID=13818 RepID=A0A9D4UKW0_ADICA|nr:hypothetical protein GOP47_0016026 [Adiantum capillus-veneris]
MRQMTDVVRPDLIVLVMDASIGQSAYGHTLAFEQSVPVGAVILTKMDGTYAKGGGALSAVAATKCPIIFLATGEHMASLLPAYEELSSKLSAMDGDAIHLRSKRFMVIMDSMTDEELDSTDISKLVLLQSSRMQRIAQGSGRVQAVLQISEFQERRQ